MSFVVLNYYCLGFMQIHAHFYIIYYSKLPHIIRQFYIRCTIKIYYEINKLSVYMKARELQENLLNDTERFSSEEEHQRAIEALSKDLDAVKQSILDDSKIVKKGVRGISVKIYPENE